MQFSINNSPSYTSVTFTLDLGESIVAENGAMIGMSGSIQVSTSSRTGGGAGGILKGLKRMFSGESFFLNTFTAAAMPGEVRISPALIGDIKHVQLDGSQVLVVQGSSYLASSPGIDIDTKWGGFKSMLGGETFFMVKVSGKGDVFINSYGAIFEKEIAGEYIVDTGHIVAFPESLQYKLHKAGNWKSFFLSGEGLVCTFSGKGRLYMQTHNPPEFGKVLGGKLPPREN